MNDQTTLAGEVARAFRDHGITAALTALAGPALAADHEDQGRLEQALRRAAPPQVAQVTWPAAFSRSKAPADRNQPSKSWPWSQRKA